MTATGTGPAVVLRNGVAITGTWTRSSLTQPATLTDRRRSADHPAAGQHLGGAGAPGRPRDHHGGTGGAGRHHHDPALTVPFRPRPIGTGRADDPARVGRQSDGASSDRRRRSSAAMVAYWRTRSRSPGTVKPKPPWRGRDGPGPRTPCRRAGRPARSGPATPVTDSPTSAPSTRRAPSAIARAAVLGDHRSLGHAEHLELDLGRVGHHRAPEPRLAPGTLTSRDAARPPVSDSARPRVSPSAASDRATASSMASSSIAEHHVAGRLGQDRPDRRLVPVERAPAAAASSAARTVTRTLIPSIPLARKAMVAVPPDESAPASSSSPSM